MNNLSSFFSYLLIITLFSPPLILSASECHCNNFRLLSETDNTTSECNIEKCTEGCSCKFSSSRNKVHGNFFFPGPIQSHLFKMIVSCQYFHVLTTPDESMHLYFSLMPQMKIGSSIATHISCTVLRI